MPEAILYQLVSPTKKISVTCFRHTRLSSVFLFAALLRGRRSNGRDSGKQKREVRLEGEGTTPSPSDHALRFFGQKMNFTLLVSSS